MQEWAVRPAKRVIEKDAAMATKDAFYGPLERISDTCWRIPKSYNVGMRVDGLVFADDELIEVIRKDQALEQVVNVAFLPGIQQASLAMPDIPSPHSPFLLEAVVPTAAGITHAIRRIASF